MKKFIPILVLMFMLTSSVGILTAGEPANKNEALEKKVKELKKERTGAWKAFKIAERESKKAQNFGSEEDKKAAKEKASRAEKKYISARKAHEKALNKLKATADVKKDPVKPKVKKDPVKPKVKKDPVKPKVKKNRGFSPLDLLSNGERLPDMPKKKRQKVKQADKRKTWKIRKTGKTENSLAVMLFSGATQDGQYKFRRGGMGIGFGMFQPDGTRLAFGGSFDFGITGQRYVDGSYVDGDMTVDSLITRDSSLSTMNGFFSAASPKSGLNDVSIFFDTQTVKEEITNDITITQPGFPDVDVFEVRRFNSRTGGGSLFIDLNPARIFSKSDNNNFSLFLGLGKVNGKDSNELAVRGEVPVRVSDSWEEQHGSIGLGFNVKHFSVMAARNGVYESPDEHQCPTPETFLLTLTGEYEGFYLSAFSKRGRGRTSGPAPQASRTEWELSAGIPLFGSKGSAQARTLSIMKGKLLATRSCAGFPHQWAKPVKGYLDVSYGETFNANEKFLGRRARIGISFDIGEDFTLGCGWYHMEFPGDIKSSGGYLGLDIGF